MFKIQYPDVQVVFTDAFTFRSVLNSLKNDERWKEVVKIEHLDEKGVLLARKEGEEVKITKEGLKYFLNPDNKNEEEE